MSRRPYPLLRTFAIVVCLIPILATRLDASRRDRASAQNKQDCENWCRGNPQCEKCSTHMGCGVGFTHLKTFGGYGDNWFACGKNQFGQASDNNQRECEDWCRGQARCSKCSDKVGCGTGYTSIKTFGGRGENYHACKKAGSADLVWPGTGVVRAEHRVLVVSLGGSGASSSDDGFEWFCEDFFAKDLAEPSVLCISSWGNITTRSEVLSNNTAAMAREMRRVSGVDPKIVLVGKSMGACKLHHAVAGEKGASDAALQRMDIDLFVGIDMSCSVARHFEKGERDALWFQDNVKQLLVFYEDKIGESQTGHQGIFAGRSFDPAIHVNVNREGFDVHTERKNGSALCSNAGHGEIDDCAPLRRRIHDLVKKKAGLSF